jgi:hypothetical protein
MTDHRRAHHFPHAWGEIFWTIIEDEHYEALPLDTGATLKQPQQPLLYAQAAPALRVNLPMGPPGSDPGRYAYALDLRRCRQCTTGFTMAIPPHEQGTLKGLMSWRMFCGVMIASAGTFDISITAAGRLAGRTTIIPWS